MNKEKLITVAYLLASVGLFVLAIDMWICGGEPYCRSSNSLSSQIARATLTITPQMNIADSTIDWSGPSDPQFQIISTGGQVTVPIPSDGDGDGDGH